VCLLHADRVKEICEVIGLCGPKQKEKKKKGGTGARCKRKFVTLVFYGEKDFCGDFPSSAKSWEEKKERGGRELLFRRLGGQGYSRDGIPRQLTTSSLCVVVLREGKEKKRKELEIRELQRSGRGLGSQISGSAVVN